MMDELLSALFSSSHGRRLEWRQGGRGLDALCCVTVFLGFSVELEGTKEEDGGVGGDGEGEGSGVRG